MSIIDINQKPTNGDIAIFENGKWKLVNKNSVLIPAEEKIKQLQQVIDSQSARIDEITKKYDDLLKEVNQKLAKHHDALQVIIKEL